MVVWKKLFRAKESRMKKASGAFKVESTKSKEEAYEICRKAQELDNKAQYAKELVLLDRLMAAPPEFIDDRYTLRDLRARALCRVGRYDEAEKEFEALLDTLRRFRGGENVARNSKVMFWYRRVSQCDAHCNHYYYDYITFPGYK